MKLLLDENLSPAQAGALRHDGFDAVSAVEVGLAGAAHELIRECAVSENRILITLDADFANILRFPPGITPGVLRLKIHPPLEDAVLELMRLALDLLKDTNLKGCLAVAHGNTVRIKR